MNESFMRKVYENPTENVMQQGLNFYSQQFKSLIKTFPSADIPIFLAAMKLSLIHISEPTRPY